MILLVWGIGFQTGSEYFIKFLKKHIWFSYYTLPPLDFAAEFGGFLQWN